MIQYIRSQSAVYKWTLCSCCCRKWLVMNWNSWGTCWPRRPSENIRWQRLEEPQLTCCSVASAGRKTVPTTRYIDETAFSNITGFLAVDIYSAYEPSIQSSFICCENKYILSNVLNLHRCKLGVLMNQWPPLCCAMNVVIAGRSEKCVLAYVFYIFFINQSSYVQ